MNKVYQCKTILKHIKNDTTQIIEKEDFKGSYYSYINDTIYIAKEQESTKSKEEEYIVLCHECVHSVQNKLLHAVNFYSSNIELLLSLIVIILLIINVNIVKYFLILYLGIFVINILVRFFLERDAVRKSFILARKLMDSNIYNIKSIEERQKEANSKQILFYISLFWKKILKLIVIVLLINII